MTPEQKLEAKLSAPLINKLRGTMPREAFFIRALEVGLCQIVADAAHVSFADGSKRTLCYAELKQWAADKEREAYRRANRKSAPDESARRGKGLS